MITLKTLGLVFRILGIFFVFQVLFRAFRRIYHFPAPAFISVALDSDLRRKLQPPDLIVARAGIKEGMSVLDLGCGPGFFTIPIARAVGPQGKVYALDIQPAMLARLEAKLAQPENADVGNIEPRLASAYELPFGDNYLDAASLVGVLDEIPDQPRALKELRRVLKPGGILAVSEHLVDPDFRLPRETARAGERAGFALEQVLGNLWSYTVRFRKPEHD